jgi:hypothetical protein
VPTSIRLLAKLLICSTGDAYLKYCSSVNVFLIAPIASENQLHSSRMHVISNKTLQSCAQRAGLPKYIHTKPFAQKSWLPPNFSVVPDPPKFSDDTDEQAPALDGIEGDLARSKAATDKAAASAMKADVRHIEDKARTSHPLQMVRPVDLFSGYCGRG